MSEVPKSYSHISARLGKYLESWGKDVAQLEASSEFGATTAENKPEHSLYVTGEDEVSTEECSAPAEKGDGARTGEVQMSYAHDSARLKEFLGPWGEVAAQPEEPGECEEAVALLENEPEDVLSPPFEDEVSAGECTAEAESGEATPNTEALVKVVTESPAPSDDDATAHAEASVENELEDVLSPPFEDEVSAGERTAEAESGEATPNTEALAKVVAQSSVSSEEGATSQNGSRSAASESSETNCRAQTIYEHLCAAKEAEVVEQSLVPPDGDATPNTEVVAEVVEQSPIPADDGAMPKNVAGGVVNSEPRHWSERIPVWRSIKAIQRQVWALEAQCEAQVMELDAKYGMQLGELGSQVTELDAKYGVQVGELGAQVGELGSQVRGLDAKYETQVEALEAKYEAQVAALEAKYEAQLESNQALENRLTELSRYLGYEHAQDPAFDQWYQSLQDLHRGSSEDLALLQSSYLPYFEVRAPVLQPAGPVLDLGCGRGEWLSMMAEQGWQVRGVDSSELAVKAARAQGLEVFKDDLLIALESQQATSLAAVTAFQVVEHLPFECVVALLQAAFRALLPGGILLLETPNPENLQVASYSFWMDPTHKKPIPPPLLMDLSFHAGFRDGLVLRQNPWPDWQGEEAEPSLEGQMNHRLYGPQDYALLAYKPATSS